MLKSYHPMPSAKTCAEAWLGAARYLLDNGPINTMILHIENPANLQTEDDAVISEVDSFLRTHGVNPIQTVANTIFPQALYRPGEPDKLFERYRASFKMQKKITRDWGRYFDRLINWPSSNGGSENQLKQLIENIRKYGPLNKNSSNYSNMYEMTLFHPEKDARKPLGRQCLSFIEVKPEKVGNGAVLHMTAVYRSHYYVARTLGNLVGLGRLLDFIATETGYKPGSLTIHSTHAELDTGKTDVGKGKSRWGKDDIKALIERCEELKPSPAQKKEPLAAA